MTENIAQMQSDDVQEADDTQKGRYLIFQLDGEEYGIGISEVIEILAMQPITPIPESAPYVKGIINLRGKIITVIDMRLKFNKQAAEYNDRTCVIIIEVDGVREGIIVDSVVEVATIANEDIALPPEDKTGFQNQYISGINGSGDKVRLLLDSQKLISDNGSTKLCKVSQ